MGKASVFYKNTCFFITMKKIRIKDLILIMLILVQCSTDEADENPLNSIDEEVLKVDDTLTNTNETTSDNSSNETQTSFDHHGMLINWVVRWDH